MYAVLVFEKFLNHHSHVKNCPQKIVDKFFFLNKTLCKEKVNEIGKTISVNKPYCCLLCVSIQYYVYYTRGISLRNFIED